MHRHNSFCPYCLSVFKDMAICGKCQQPMIGLSYKARVPSKKAKKKKWVQFFLEFPYVTLRCPQTKALSKRGIDISALLLCI